ncbi:chromo domain-containing protein, partial [Aeromonas veronii]|nr:chromo domain-containing protein [Aeromonas veronii]
DHTRGVFPPPPPPIRDARGSTRWIVERIVDHSIPKTNPQGARFRIRWRGFPPHRDTWEPRNVLLEDVPEMVRAYEEQYALAQRK